MDLYILHQSRDPRRVCRGPRFGALPGPDEEEQAEEQPLGLGRTDFSRSGMVDQFSSARELGTTIISNQAITRHRQQCKHIPDHDICSEETHELDEIDEMIDGLIKYTMMILKSQWTK